MALGDETVEKHRTKLMRELGLRSAAALAADAIPYPYPCTSPTAGASSGA